MKGMGTFKMTQKVGQKIKRGLTSLFVVLLLLFLSTDVPMFIFRAVKTAFA
jgi:hypothetical protein